MVGLVDFSGAFVYGNVLKRRNWGVMAKMEFKPIMCSVVKEVNKQKSFIHFLKFEHYEKDSLQHSDWFDAL